jgi:hypothetical protein
LLNLKKNTSDTFLTSAAVSEQGSKMNNHLSFEEGWKVLEQGIVKCSKILECTSTRPTVNEYMNYYEYASMASRRCAYLYYYPCVT